MTSSIPGYYFDASKNKFFKIQPDHQAPPGVHYAQSQIHRDARDARHRRLDAARSDRLATATVRRWSARRDPVLADLGLAREHGGVDGARAGEAMQVQRHRAVVAHWRPSRTDILLLGNDDGFAQRSLGRVVDVQRAACKDEWVYVTRFASGRWQLCSGPATPFRNAPLRVTPRALSPVSLTPISAFAAVDLGDRTLIAACTEAPGIMYMTTLSGQQQFPPAADRHTLPIGSPVMNLWALATNRPGARVAVAGTARVVMLSFNAEVAGVLTPGDDVPPGHEIRALDWLSPTLLATALHPRQTHICDSRARFSTLRLKHPLPITNITHADPSAPYCLLVTTARHISVYDLRHTGGDPNSPLLSIQHVSQGPSTLLATDGAGLVAAADRDERVVVYSTRTGEREVLPMPAGPAMEPGARLTSLRWAEDARGRPLVRAMKDGTVLEWNWEDEGA